jgi:hypothetical protein
MDIVSEWKKDPLGRERRRRTKEAETKFNKDVERIKRQTRNSPGAQEARLNARRRALSRKLVKIEEDKGCAVTAIVIGAAIVSGIATWRGWA